MYLLQVDLLFYIISLSYHQLVILFYLHAFGLTNEYVNISFNPKLVELDFTLSINFCFGVLTPAVALPSNCQMVYFQIHIF